MNKEYYPWSGDFTSCSINGCIAVVLLNIKYTPSKKVAIYGQLKTENIGIEKIVANVISNPHIRYIAICGKDIRGHYPGKTLIALYKNGIDKNCKIINAPGAIPYIENLDKEAIKRFCNQIKIVDLIGITDKYTVDNKIDKYILKSPKPFGEPYIALKIENQSRININDKRALHSKIIVNYMGKVEKRGK